MDKLYKDVLWQKVVSGRHHHYNSVLGKRDSGLHRHILLQSLKNLSQEMLFLLSVNVYLKRKGYMSSPFAKNVKNIPSSR